MLLGMITAFVNGVAFAIGFWLFSTVLRFFHPQEDKASKLLSERNEIGRQHILATERLAEAVEEWVNRA